jgi:hypothetical protein
LPEILENFLFNAMKIDFIRIKEFCDEQLAIESYSHNWGRFVDGIIVCSLR